MRIAVHPSIKSFDSCQTAVRMSLSRLQQSPLISSSKQAAVLPNPALHTSTTVTSRGIAPRIAHVCHAVESQQQEQQLKFQPESAVPGMSSYLDSLCFAKDGLVPVIVQVR